MKYLKSMSLGFKDIGIENQREHSILLLFSRIQLFHFSTKKDPLVYIKEIFQPKNVSEYFLLNLRFSPFKIQICLYHLENIQICLYHLEKIRKVNFSNFSIFSIFSI